MADDSPAAVIVTEDGENTITTAEVTPTGPAGTAAEYRLAVDALLQGRGGERADVLSAGDRQIHYSAVRDPAVVGLLEAILRELHVMRKIMEGAFEG